MMKKNQIELKGEGEESDSATVIEQPIMDQTITTQTTQNQFGFTDDETNPINQF